MSEGAFKQRTIAIADPIEAALERLLKTNEPACWVGVVKNSSIAWN